MQMIPCSLLKTEDGQLDEPTSRLALAVTLQHALLALLVSLTFAAAPATANPALEGYADYAAFRAQIDELEISDVCCVTSLGKTLGSRDVFLLTIGTGSVDKKPALLIVGNTHEPLLVGSELAIRIAQRLTRRYAESEEIKELLAQYTCYIVPRPNPDGSERLFAPPWRERAGNDRPTDDDRDFANGEDPPNDLNGDGWITMMRVADETGTYMLHAEDARILIEADTKKNERGQFKLYSEGTDDDEDEKWNEDGGDGVSLNRNFTFRYPHLEVAAGPHAVSEPETRMIADFAFDHPNIAVVFSFTPEDNLMHPWKSDSSSDGKKIPMKVLSADAPFFDFLATRYQDMREVKGAPTSSKGNGSFSEWAYFHYGRWSLAARGWWPHDAEIEPDKGQDQDEEQASADDSEADGKESTTANAPQQKESTGNEEDNTRKRDKDDRGAEELAVLRWMDSTGIDAFVPWTSIEHPDFPDKKVEIGGFKPFYRLNPPAHKLDELAGEHVSFLQELAALMPVVKIQSTKVDALGAGVYRVVVEIANLGYLPTASEMGERSRQAYPLQIELQLPAETQFIQGSARQPLKRLSGNGGHSEKTWIVRTADEQTTTGKLRVWAPAVGTDEVSIQLNEQP